MHSVACPSHSVAYSSWEHMRARVPGAEVLSHAVAMATSAQVSIHGLNLSWWTSLAVIARRVVPVYSSVPSEDVQCC